MGSIGTMLNFNAKLNSNAESHSWQSFNVRWHSVSPSLALGELGSLENEKQLEDSLIENITKFMLELGKGFAYVGRQFKLEVGGQEFFIDLLFYNYILRRFIVIELKTTDFKPDYVGQLNFYVAAVNKQVKSSQDEATVGLLICRNNNKTVVEYTLSQINQPTTVASYKLPEELQQQLPDEEEIISGISKLL